MDKNVFSQLAAEFDRMERRKESHELYCENFMV